MLHVLILYTYIISWLQGRLNVSLSSVFSLALGMCRPVGQSTTLVHTELLLELLL